MTDKNRVAPQYQGMLGMKSTQRQPAEGAQSATEQVLSQMSEGERWALEAAERDYRTGGNEPGGAAPTKPE